MSSPNHHTVLPRSDDTSYLSPGGVKGLSISVVFTALATCFVLARLYTRTRLMNRMESNDWMIVIALVRHLCIIHAQDVRIHVANYLSQVFSFVFMALFIVEALNGVGMHGVDIPPPVLIKQMKVSQVSFRQ